MSENYKEEYKKNYRRPPAKKTPMMMINEVSKIFHDEMRGDNIDANIQGSYRELLFHLAHEDGRTQLELSRLTHLKPPTVSVTLQKMESDGYVLRKSDENDLRQTRVYLTEKGFAYDIRARERIAAAEKKVMANVTEEESELLLGLLEKMKKNLIGDEPREEIYERPRKERR